MGLTDLSTLSQLPCGKGSKAHLNDLSWYFLCQPLYNSLTELPLADPDDLNEKIDPVRVIRDDGNTSPVRALPTAHFVGSKFKGCFFLIAHETSSRGGKEARAPAPRRPPSSSGSLVAAP